MSTVITCRCPFCGTISEIACEESAYIAYENGALIQDVFPTMDIHSRETLISGLCLPCQESFFVEDDEDECNGECDTCPDTECPSNVNFLGGCNGVCELCSLGDDCPNSTNY